MIYKTYFVERNINLPKAAYGSIYRYVTDAVYKTREKVSIFARLKNS